MLFVTANIGMYPVCYGCGGIFFFAGPQYMRNNCWFCVAAT